MANNERPAEAFGPSPERIRRVDLILRLGREANRGCDLQPARSTERGHSRSEAQTLLASLSRRTTSPSR